MEKKSIAKHKEGDHNKSISKGINMARINDQPSSGIRVLGRTVYGEGWKTFREVMAWRIVLLATVMGIWFLTAVAALAGWTVL